MPVQTKRVRIFTTPTCPSCECAKAFCREHGVEFGEVDVLSDHRGHREMLLMTGQHAVPVVLVGDKAMVGWDAAEFRRLMGWAPARA